MTTLEEAYAAAGEAMRQVEHGTDPAWKAQAEAKVWEVAQSRPFFTTDEVWDAGLPTGEEPRGLGPIMARLGREGLIGTGRHKPSRRRHASPVKVWGSPFFSRTPDQMEQFLAWGG